MITVSRISLRRLLKLHASVLETSSLKGLISKWLANKQLQIQEQYQSKMAVRLRLARFGCRNRPFYRVMAANSRSPRDGKHLEVLGYYNPLPGIGCPLVRSLLNQFNASFSELGFCLRHQWWSWAAKNKIGIEAMVVSEMKLLGSWRSPFVMRARIALNLKYVEYEVLEEKFGLKSNLLSNTTLYQEDPVLLHHNRPICESLIIVQYIDKNWTSSPFIMLSDPMTAPSNAFGLPT
ncbi:hypothetical protein Sjap_015885 [Stephania japonica]|uniref:Glutathione S-transferase n=1 Tax=Stephania japonica TaxID=461633 RepID=A0AAP0IK35_9MAGN